MFKLQFKWTSNPVSKTGVVEHGKHQYSGEDITENLPKYR
jgi:hypothetical protein